MRKIFFILIIATATTGLFKSTVKAQSLPVGTPALDDYYRRMQLLGKVDSNVSFTIRPLFPGAAFKTHNVYDPDTTLKNDSWTPASPFSFANGAGLFQILPFGLQQQFNSDHPYGWNDGPMIPAKGYQTMISGGIFVKYGPLSIQLMPEFVYAANPPFTSFAAGRSDLEMKQYYGFYNSIDNPERFGTKAYSKAFLGQSSIRLTFNPISIGLSNENIWWGPGIRNSLILSNNAPGFKHITINTVRPINTPVGSFEFQVIAAHLNATNFTPLATTTISTGQNLVRAKTNDWRYYTGVNINYHIKWVPGLTLGLTRTFDAYHKDINTLSEYVPFFFPYQKQNTNDGDPIPRDQLTSLYARWLFTKAQAEVYFEYGLNDNSYNFRDFIGSPDHSRAYILGVRKMLPFGTHEDQHILLSGEITQLSQTVDRLVRQASGWYIHSGVRQGQTNEGQVLGAGTGSGGNLQSMDVSWVSGLKKLGVRIERYEHNADLATAAFADINGNSRRWVDLAFALQGEWNYKNLIFNATIEGVRSLNYQWFLKDYNSSQYYIPHNDVYNLHTIIGVTYRF